VKQKTLLCVQIHVQGKLYSYLRPGALLSLCAMALLAILWKQHQAAFGKESRRILAPVSLDRNYAFIQYDDNQLRFFGAPEKWNLLFGKLDSLVFEGEGNISFLHIGGSHVQGGFLTDRLRARFAEMSTGVSGDRGFLFPYKMAGGNMSSSTVCQWTGKWNGQRCSVNDHSAPWGMAGVEALTTDSVASFTIASRKADSTFYDFNILRVYHRSNHSVLTMDTTVTILTIRSDTVAGFTEFHLLQPVEKMRLKIRTTPGGFFSLQGIHLANGRPGVTYNTIGVNGASTRSYLRCPGFNKQVQTLSNDLVIMAIGVNDANVPEHQFDMGAYEARYDSLCSAFRTANPNTCFLFVTNNDTFYQQRHPNRNALRVREVMQRLAMRYDGAVYDWLDIMGGLGSIRTWRDHGLAAKDLVHFSKSGYELQGDLLYLAFRDAFGRYLSLAGGTD
jgi:lysophospholipase L1-like esterase